MAIELYPHQLKAVRELSNGKILCGGVGTGKSRTAIAYYFFKEAQGMIKLNGVGETAPMKTPKDLYIITTAKKRDSLDWMGECALFMLSGDRQYSFGNVKVTIDSWNNIKNFKEVKDAFFIFDEQRLVGSGAWVKSFIKIAKKNRWILLSATPGDTYMDYIPVFVANGFYNNRTEFIHRHVVYNNFSKYPKIDHFVETGRLDKFRRSLLVAMPYLRHTVRHSEIVPVSYDQKLFETVVKKRWNPYTEWPIKDVSELFYTMRHVVNADPVRLEAVKRLTEKHPKLIIFYNFNYELDLLRTLEEELHIPMAEWNGHKHEEIPKTDQWLYLVQYTSGAEGWNCTETDAMVFYSLNYSYRIMQQCEGRIDRLNTPFTDLYYYTLRSNSQIDVAIMRALKNKEDFNYTDVIGKFTNTKFDKKETNG